LSNNYELARGFLHTAHSLIEKHNIQPKNIIDLDQVPRYFETEPTSTITARGSRNVLLRKGGASHKHFTVTFCILANGTFHKPHILFSDVKSKSNLDTHMLVDVNKTGMWNDDITMRFIENSIIFRSETRFHRQPVLLIMDQYSIYVNISEYKILEKYDIFVVLVPGRLPLLLQPLDTTVNRSFQSSDGISYDSYIQRVLNEKDLRTKAGNPKVPSYHDVMEWSLKWMRSVDLEILAKASVFVGSLTPVSLKSVFSLDRSFPCLTHHSTLTGGRPNMVTC
jgi:hypothetical protein